jgi:hypothetical protein
MKRLLTLTFTIMLILLATPPRASAQQANQDPAPAAPGKSDTAGVPPQHANEAQMPASGETTTEPTKMFSGVIAKEQGEIVLKDPVTKVIYKLDDAAKAQQFMGRRVRVVGKLEMNSNKILIDSIEPIS